jgi:hypothetical protein
MKKRLPVGTNNCTFNVTCTLTLTDGSTVSKTVPVTFEKGAYN